MKNDYATLDLTPVAPHYSFSYQATGVATGVNLMVLVQSLLKGGGAGKCTFKTGVTDSRDKREKDKKTD